MRFVDTGLPGAWLIEVEPHADDRGLFARTFCRRELAAQGVDFEIVQCSTSYNARAGTLRGMHWQEGEAAEDKLVRCTRGVIHDVVVDLRAGSATRLKWYAAELSADNRRTLYVPKGFAHGFMTLTPDAEVFYSMSQFHAPGAARGARWNDPAFGIRWPAGEPILSERDRGYPDFAP
jgi:dTDP-4-dehydrorhamnose 3,5-epimerase